MYNSNTPPPAELPSSRQLLRSTMLAAIAAAVLLVTVVLPAEYGIDPTGVGRVLRLTEMGEIKKQLAAEAEADAAAAPRAQASTPAAPTAAPQAPAPAVEAAQAAPWRNEMRVTLTPGEGAEIKLRMQAGDKANTTGSSKVAWSTSTRTATVADARSATKRDVVCRKTGANWWPHSPATMAGTGATGARRM